MVRPLVDGEAGVEGSKLAWSGPVAVWNMQ
jgi:hypothetical protein